MPDEQIEFEEIKTDEKIGVNIVLARQLDRIMLFATNATEASTASVAHYYQAIRVFKAAVNADLIEKKVSTTTKEQNITTLLSHNRINSNRKAINECTEYLEYILQNIPDLLRKRSKDVDA